MSASIEVEDFLRSLTDLMAGLRNSAHQALVTAVRAAHQSAITTDLFKDRLGKLRSTIRFEITDPLEGRVMAGGRGVRYAGFVNDGTRPHDIVPKRKSALRFVLGDQIVFRRLVHHPGTEARPFMTIAADVGERTLERVATDATDRVVLHFNES